MGYIPCQMGERDRTHKYNIHDWKPFRLRCALNSCHHNMYEAQAMSWFAELVDRDHVTREAVGMSSVSSVCGIQSVFV